MSKVELKITYISGNKQMNQYHIKGHEDVVTIGSSPNAKIRTLNPNVDDIHVCIENRNGTWHVVDLASKGGAWIGKTAIDETPITTEATLNIGDEQFLIQPIEIKSYNLYQKNKRINFADAKNTVKSQQVIIGTETEIFTSEMVAIGEKIKLTYDGKDHTFDAADSEDWKVDRLEKVVVKRRNVTAPVFINPRPKKAMDYFPEDMIKSMGIAFGIMFFFALSAWLMPKLMPKDPNALEKNNYTQMIVDPEIIKKQQEKAEESKKKIEKKEEKKPEVAKVEPERKKPVSIPKTEAAKKVVTQLKTSGLSDQISKIAAVSISTDSLLAGANSQDLSKVRNRGFASQGVAVKGATLSKNAGTYNVSAVSTNGVAGGTAAVGKLGGLSAGTVGGGGVVDAIEEETEISGGIDPAIIRDVVQKNMGRIRYCYERELAANPKLYGKVKLAWTITAGGAVAGQKIEQTTLKNNMVEGCMLRIVQRWTFPRPDGGGDVIVAFPFFFKANN